MPEPCSRCGRPIPAVVLPGDTLLLDEQTRLLFDERFCWKESGFLGEIDCLKQGYGQIEAAAVVMRDVLNDVCNANAEGREFESCSVILERLGKAAGQALASVAGRDLFDCLIGLSSFARHVPREPCADPVSESIRRDEAHRIAVAIRERLRASGFGVAV